MIRFKIEPFFAIMNELPELFMEHHKLVKQPFYKELKVDWKKYLLMEQAGLLHVLTARDDEKLVGYIFFNVTPHVLYSDLLHCFVDIYFLHPDYRKGLAGVKMFKTFEKTVKDAGVKIIYVSYNLGYNEVKKLLEHLEYEPGEETFIKKVA